MHPQNSKVIFWKFTVFCFVQKHLCAKTPILCLCKVSSYEFIWSCTPLCGLPEFIFLCLSDRKQLLFSSGRQEITWEKEKAWFHCFNPISYVSQHNTTRLLYFSKHFWAVAWKVAAPQKEHWESEIPQYRAVLNTLTKMHRLKQMGLFPTDFSILYMCHLYLFVCHGQ